MSTDDDGPIILGFVGYAAETMSAAVTSYEDALLTLLAEHGARVIYRGRKHPGQPTELPQELQLLWFPNRGALAAYLADGRRTDLVSTRGNPFSFAHAVELETIYCDGDRS